MTTRSYVVLENRGVLAVGGEDRRSFLQGLISNDVEAVSGERAVYSAFLTPQGKYLHDFFLFEAGGELMLEMDAGRLADLKKRLTMYKLRSKVTLEDRCDAFRVAAAFDDGALEAFGLPAEPGAARGFGGGVAFVDPRLAELGARVVLPGASMPAALQEAGLAEGGLADYERLRLRLGVPDGTRDLQQERSILLENGFEELNGVSFDKGCYMGQELTSRTKHRGLVKKRLVPVEIDGPAPEPGTPVMAGDKEAGEMRSSDPDGAWGLAMLRLEQLSEGGTFTCDRAMLTAHKPPWARF